MEYSPRYGRFRALLRQIREEAGLTQEQLAEALSRPQTFVSKAELGERRIDFMETLDYCAACNLSPSQFITRLEQSGIMTEPTMRRKRRSPRKMDSQGKLTD